MKFKILGIEHIGVAQNSGSNKLSNFFSDTLKLHSTKELVDNQKVITEIFDTGSVKIELLYPSDKSSVLDKFLSKKGESIHHIAILVDNLDELIKHLISKDIKLINKTPQKGADNKKIIFIHPYSSPGMLLEFCQEI